MLLTDDEFQLMQMNFMEKYYQEFEDTEENKFVYTDIHKEYVSKFVCHCTQLYLYGFYYSNFYVHLYIIKSHGVGLCMYTA